MRQATRRNAGPAPQRAKYVALPMGEGGRVVPVDKWEADHVRNYSTADWKAKVQVWHDSQLTTLLTFHDETRFITSLLLLMFPFSLRLYR